MTEEVMREICHRGIVVGVGFVIVVVTIVIAINVLNNRKNNAHEQITQNG